VSCCQALATVAAGHSAARLHNNTRRVLIRPSIKRCQLSPFCRFPSQAATLHQAL
jgi:hypothetical protein